MNQQILEQKILDLIRFYEAANNEVVYRVIVHKSKIPSKDCVQVKTAKKPDLDFVNKG